MKKVSYVVAVLAILTSLCFGSVHAAQDVTSSSPINLNTATQEQLVSLPGIGKSKADAIITYRQEHPFKAVSELAEVRGIGPKLLEKLQNQVMVDGSLAVQK